MHVVWPRLDRRELVGELMDDPSLSEREHLLALRGLRRINTVFRTAPSLFNELARLFGDASIRTPRVLDVACGDGWNTIRLAQLARENGLRWQVSGCDLSGRAVSYARDHAARAGVEAGFFVADALSELDTEGYDAVVNNLFLHHLEDKQVIAFLRRLRSARHIVINDLIRGRMAYAVTLLGVHALSRSRVVHVDGPRSVRAALTPGEMRGNLLDAGLDGAVIKCCWPMRQVVVWSRPS